MKVKLFYKLLFVISIITMGNLTKAALTPVEYCKTLPAISCEVLNFEFTSGSISDTRTYWAIAAIKYCKNQLFKIKLADCMGNSGSGPSHCQTQDPTSLNQTTILANQSYPQVSYVANSASLCTWLP